MSRPTFTDSLNAIKESTFGRADVVLHRRDIIDRKLPFDVLDDAQVKERFDDQLVELIADATYRVFTVVIDKLDHKRKYMVWRFHPYHYCMTVLLERYVQWLARIGQTGDVLFESRGKKENIQLERSFRRIYDSGTDQVPAKIIQARLTSRQLKIQPKEVNIAALQLADLIANPSCRALICEKTGVQMTAAFGTRVVEILRKNKYLRRFDGLIQGWGTKWLP